MNDDVKAQWLDASAYAVPLGEGWGARWFMFRHRVIPQRRIKPAQEVTPFTRDDLDRFF
jgi:hypothetical protein